MSQTRINSAFKALEGIKGAMRKRGVQLLMKGYGLYWVEKNCGKPNCSKCPHGPYLYAIKTDGGKTKSEYLGKR